MAGIYLHIPFCKQQCTYCDFHFSTTFEKYRTQMVDALVLELEQRVKYLEGKTVETIYFGGGTPSILSHQELNRLLTRITELFNVVAQPEITLEANPDDITAVRLNEWKEQGVNRLSIGLQSFKPSDLEWMNRAHSVEEAFNCLDLSLAHGFDNITVDLMYGLPNLSNDEWRSHIQTVIKKGVKHVSAYCLTVEEDTVLDKWVEKKKIIPASEDQQSDQFLILLEELEAGGILQYEISNFAKPGHESVHNSNYWKGKWYLGIGPSAHSFNGNSRSWNIANNQQYMRRVLNENAPSELEELSEKDQFNERLLTGLRTIYGVNLDELNALQPLSDTFQSELKQFIHQQWIVQEENHIFLTKEGRLRADFIAAELFV